MSLDLFGSLPAGSAVASDTSEAAADTLQRSGRLAKLRREVLMLFAAAAERGLTADEVTAAMGSEDHNSFAPRVTELRSMGYLDHTWDTKATVVATGRAMKVRRLTRKGSPAFVMVITQAGRKALTP